MHPYPPLRRRALARPWGGIFFFVLALHLLPLACASQGVGLAPPRIELVLAPGERVTRKFIAFTTEGRAIPIQPDLFDYTQDGLGNIHFLPPGHTPYSLFPYLQVALDPFDVQKGKNHPIPFTVTAPENGEGSYWIALSLTTQPLPRKEKGELAVRAVQRIRILAGIYVTVAGTARPRAELVSPRWLKRNSASGSTQTYFQVEIKNRGNTYLRLTPRLFFKDKTGKEIFSTMANELLILRGEDVRVAIPFPEAPEEAILGGVEFLSTGPPAVRLTAPLYAEKPLE